MILEVVLPVGSSSRNIRQHEGLRKKKKTVLTRHGVAVKVISDGLLQLVVGRGLLEALAQVVLQVLVQFASF